MKFFSTKKSVLESALYYASSGYKVFPCFYNQNDNESKGSFSPFCQHGFKAATTDAEKIKEWWTTFPTALIGISTGVESGILAITTDEKSDFSAKTPCYIDNFSEKTYFFKCPKNEKIGCSEIENFYFNGETSFIVVPPSAGDYKGDFEIEILTDGELAEVPVELLKKIKEIEATKRTLSEILVDFYEKAEEVPAEVPVQLQHTETTQENDDSEEQEEEKKGLPELPLHCLPPILQKLITGTAMAMNVDPWLSFAAAMQTVSTLVGANYMLDGMIPAPAHMWTAIVGPSGSGKSAICRLFSAPIKKRQDYYDESFATNMKEYEEALLIYEDDLKTWNKNGREGQKPTEPTKPICKTYFVNDITSEKLQLTLAENPGGVCWSPDELTKLLGSFGRYSKGGSKTAVDPAKSTILSAFDGGDCRTSRMGREQVKTDHAWLSIYGTIQPEILESSFQKEDLYSGFLHRFIFFVLSDQGLLHQNKRPILKSFQPEIEKFFEPLLDGHEVVLKKMASEEDLFDKKTESKLISIEKEGILLIQDYCYALDEAAINSKKLGEESSVGNLKTMAGRLQGQLPRLILILHALECTEKGVEITGVVSTQTVKKAIEIFTAITKHIYYAWSLITGKQRVVTAKKEECLEILATIDPYVSKNNDFYEISYTDVYKGQKLAEILIKKLFAEGGTKQKLTKALEKLGFKSWRRETGKIMRMEKADYETKFLKAVGTKKLVVQPQAQAGAEVSNIF